MTAEEREQRAIRIADFRYSLIAELANPYLNREERRRRLREKAGIEYEVPAAGRRKLSAGCLRKWLRLYLKYGKPGLLPHPRRDIGKPRALSEAEAALLLSTLEQMPQLTAIAVLRKLQQEGKISRCPSSSSLSRLVRAAGMQRDKRLQEQDQELKLKFDFFAPLECLQADCLYTLTVPDSKGKRRQAILLSFLDDATRRVVFATFGFSEQSLAFERGIKHILAAHGRIGRLYVDNASSFLSAQTQRILDTLGILLVHSRPGKPAGRGKLERFHRTARDQFFRLQDSQSIASLADLDTRFHTWLEGEYHRSPHRGLGGKTPLEAWVEKAHLIIPMDPTVDLDRLFLHEASRKVYKDSTITLDGVLYEVPSTLAGQRILLRYDPFVPPQRRRLLVVHEGRECGEARIVDSYANARVRRGDLHKDAVIDRLDHGEDRAPGAILPNKPAPPSPLDAALSASRVDLAAEPAEEQQS